LPPHEYALGAPTGATARGNAEAVSASSSSSSSPPFTARAIVAAASPSPPLDFSAPPQKYLFRGFVFSSCFLHNAPKFEAGRWLFLISSAVPEWRLAVTTQPD
jgi:hypothetical protein